MRENPEYRIRNRYVLDAYALKDNLRELHEQMRKRPGCPMFLADDMFMCIQEAEGLIHPLTAYRDQVPQMIEE